SPAIILWDAGTGEVVRSWQNSQTGAYNVAFSPDGRLLATGGADDDRTAAVGEGAPGRPVASVKGDHSAGRPAPLPARRRSLAAAGGDASVLLWDLTGQKGKKPAPLTPGRVAALWRLLAGEDAAKGYRAVWELALAPQQAVPFLAGKLPVARAPSAKEVAALV